MINTNLKKRRNQTQNTQLHQVYSYIKFLVQTNPPDLTPVPLNSLAYHHAKESFHFGAMAVVQNGSCRKRLVSRHLVMVALLVLFLGTCSAFLGTSVSPKTHTYYSGHHCSELYGSPSSFFQQKTGESDTDFFKRIQQAASNPEAFERIALGNDEDSETAKRLKKAQQQQQKESLSGGATNTTKTGYQRAEDWDKEMKAKAEKGEFTWEEKVCLVVGLVCGMLYLSKCKCPNHRQTHCLLFSTTASI